MAFPETLNVTDPADTQPASVLGAEIRTLKQLIADVLGVPISPNQVSAGAFTISNSGVVSVSQAGLTLPSDPTANLGAATKQYVDNSLGIKVHAQETVAAQSGILTTPTVLATLTVTTPSAGGPWRALVGYEVYCHGSVFIQSWVSDGVTPFCVASVTSAAITGSAGASVLGAERLSRQTYANGTNVTFTLYAQAAQANSDNIDAFSIYSAVPSSFQVSIIGSN